MLRLFICLFCLAGPVAAQHTHGAGHSPAALPSEPGQGAFAAIAEIVALLRADENTDWDKVDIAGLRDHLLDMDNLVTHAEVHASQIPGGAAFHIQRAGKGGDAAGRMVPAHGMVLAADTGWESHVKIGAKELIWEVTSDTDVAEIRSLGFFGLMAVGGHHQAHHLAMATGRPMH